MSKTMLKVNCEQGGVYLSMLQETCLKPCSCAQFAPRCKFAPGSKFTPGANLHPLCPVHMPINCVHTHLDLIRNLTQGTHFYEKFSVFECSY